ncbi:MAG: acyltransferase [Pleurocapsa sp. SU_5_0]|nr:acyltransferase [Pleurocapsa sp. SU_5_0]
MKILELLKSLIWIFKSPAIFWFKNLYVQLKNPSSRLSPQIIWIYDEIKNIKIEPGVTIGSFSEICVQNGTYESSKPGVLKLETGVVIGSQANIRATNGTICIKKNSILAQQVSLIGCNHKISLEKPYRDLPWDDCKTGITIEENAWIGSNVTVLPGCVIGKNSVVGAGSVLTRSIPNNEIWAGVPARKIRAINSSDNTLQKQLIDTSIQESEV